MMSPPTATSGLTGSGSLASAFVHDFLPVFAMAAGLLAVIWLACAIIATAGAYLGALVFHGARTLIRTVIRWIRRRWASEYAQLVTVNADGVTTTSVHPRRARRWHAQPPAPDDTPGPGAGPGAP
jgi:hypothetical protein